MSSVFTTALTFALLLAIAALWREVRLRRALQEIVRRLITLLRRTAGEAKPSDLDDDTEHPGDRRM